MIDPNTLVDLFSAGAIAGVSGLGGKAVTDAYDALKTILVKTYHLAAVGRLEAAPSDPEVRQQAVVEISRAAVAQDYAIEEAVVALAQALKAAPRRELLEKGVIIEDVFADRDVKFGAVSASSGTVHICTVKAGQDVVFGDIVS